MWQPLSQAARKVASRGRFYVQRNGRRESEDAKGRKGGESDCVHGGYRGFGADMVFIPFADFRHVKDIYRSSVLLLLL